MGAENFLIGIPTYNGWKRVDALLSNLRQRTSRKLAHTIVVCDDSGNDRHRARVRDVCVRWGAEYIENASNRGVPASWNALVRARPECELVALLNDDVLVDNGWLEPLHYALSNNLHVAAFSLNFLHISNEDVPKILASPDAKVVTLKLEERGGRLVKDTRFPSIQPAPDVPPIRVMCPGGCAFGFRRPIYDRIGGFDEQYFAFYEETDFGVACAEKGLPSFVLPAPWYNYHLWSATFGSAPEINSAAVMEDSRRKFLSKWNARLGHTFLSAQAIHPFLMNKIPPLSVRWMAPDGSEREALL